MLNRIHIDELPELIGDSLWLGIDGKDGQSIVGPPGRDGRDGSDGKPGTDGSGLSFKGEWRRSVAYRVNDIVTLEGSTFIATVESRGLRPRPNSSAWNVLALAGRAGERGEPGWGSRGPRGLPGASGISDLELLFDATAKAGQVIVSCGDGRCRVANGLSFYHCLDILGLAVDDTLAGSRGNVRTVGLLTLPDWSLITGGESLHPSRPYAFQGYGGLTSTGVYNTAVYRTMATSITSDTLLVMPGQGSFYGRAIDDLTAPCISTLPKGAPVYLANQTQVDAASDPDNWWVAGVLTADVEAGQEATYVRFVKITKDDWSDVLESEETLLTPNTKYYLADSPGKLTTDSEDRLFIGKAKTTTRLDVQVGDDSPNNPLVI